MNKRNVTFRKYLFAALLVFAFVTFAAAQETMRIGDMVETSDGRQCQVESITGRSAKVRCGPNRSDIRVYSFDALTSAKSAAQQREQQQQKQQEQEKQREQQERDAPTLIFHQGDTVQTQDGRTGKIEGFKNEEMAKVRFGPGANETQYFMLTTLKVIKPPKPVLSGPSEVFHVGDKVVNASGQQLTIDSIEGDTATVRYGVGNYNVYKAKLSELMSAKSAATKTASENEQKIARAGFEDEAKPFMILVRTVARGLDPKYSMSVPFNSEAATYAKWLKDLEALSLVCKKYPNLTSRPGADLANIGQNPADWCRIADQRTAVVKRMQVIVAEQRVDSELDLWTHKIDEALRNRDGYVKDEIQRLLYDRAAWEAKELTTARKIYADAGAVIPADAYAKLDEKVAELKAKIDRDAPTRSWTQPQYSDPASEAMAKRAYPSQFPGIKVYKTGMTYTTWKAMDDTSLAGSGTGYKIYKTTIGAYRYKLGLALVKLPNQPFCQIRDFQVQQDKAGGDYSAPRLNLPLGYTGIFVKCP